MSDWLVAPQTKPLAGRVRVPGDKSIGHRALLLAALCTGECKIEGLSTGEDNARTAAALRELGVRIDALSENVVIVHGVGLHGFSAPSKAIDCGNSGTTMRLLCGLLAGLPFETTLSGDASLSRRPMSRVVAPLRRMGAKIDGTVDQRNASEIVPPLTIRGGPLTCVSLRLPVASAQVKSAILLGALFTRGQTTVREPGPSRDHTERLFEALGVPLTRHPDHEVHVDTSDWDQTLVWKPMTIPGDPSSAAYLLAAAICCGGQGVCVEQVGVNHTRVGFLDVFASMRADVQHTNAGDLCGEPVADLVVGAATPLAGTTIAGELVVRSIDELPLLAALAARARGTTTIVDAAELRVKESDRIASTLAMLRSFGVQCDERDDGLVVHGDPQKELHPGDVDSCGDHRIAMSAAVLALSASGQSRVRNVQSADTSFPGFAETMGALGCSVRTV